MTAQRVPARERKLILGIIAVIIVGLGSRMIHTGLPILDKYAGDALYAVMIYLFITLLLKAATPFGRAVVAMMVMTGLETFQLTLIPLEMIKSGNVLMKVSGRLLGTTFSWLDLAAYFVGIITVFLAHKRYHG
ncbi:MAG: hypothetical protein A2075_08165 [Geobacteraceae bacterium GWC2_58_44]|nr:MAG: hypothetical protein A2075_08165 [Geobacteraceae bacterium GWC2_58_44]HBG07150.1 hypothetical protein [Geobacter sp.]